MKATLVSLLAFGLLATSSSAVVLSSTAQLIPGGFFVPDQESTLSVSIYSSEFEVFDASFAAAIVSLGGNNYEFSSGTIGHSFRIYSGILGEGFGVQEVVETTTFSSNSGSPSLGFTILPGSSLFFSYWVDEDMHDGASVGDNYGWFELRNTGGSLEIGDSAVSNRFGIIVGQNKVPEPSGVVLGVLSCCLVTLRRRR